MVQISQAGTLEKNNLAWLWTVAPVMWTWSRRAMLEIFVFYSKKSEFFFLIHQIFETTNIWDKSVQWLGEYMTEITAFLIDFTWGERNNKQPNA